PQPPVFGARKTPPTPPHPQFRGANPASQQCGAKPQTSAPLGGEQGRCGFGPRLPMLVVSPWARQNGGDPNLRDQASAINFVEYNWGLPAIAGSFDQALAGTDASEG